MRVSEGRGVVAALESALEAHPDDLDVALHLAELLVPDDPQRALELARSVLAQRPADEAALHTAIRAARAAGNNELADQFGIIASALADTQLVSGAAEETSHSLSTVVTELPEGSSDDQASGEEGQVVPLRLLEGGASEEDSGFEVERPRITLADVGGLQQVKERLTNAFLAPLRSPELRATFGKSLRGGLLLYGPPGCGKTFVARAVAGEVGARFLPVGISDILDPYVGASERRVSEIFALARRSTPCVLFIDEIDALGQKRSQLRGNVATSRNVVSQLLTELDGMRDNDGVFLLAATNHPWDVDTALRRPGRLDRTLLVLPPDEEARRAILVHHLEGRPVEAGIDLRGAAKKTKGFSGADLAAVCDGAVELALNDSIKSGQVRPVNSGDLAAALRQVKPSTRPWFDVAYNYATFANEGGQYDDLLRYIRANGLMG